MPAGTFDMTGDDARIEQGARYSMAMKIRNDVCDGWTVVVNNVGNVGDTFSITLFSSTAVPAADLPAYEETVTYTVVAGDGTDDIATGLLALLNAIAYTEQNQNCETVSVDRFTATVSGDTITIHSVGRRIYLAVTATATTPANITATHVTSVLIDITSHDFTTQVRSPNSQSDLLATWSTGAEYTISDGPLGHLDLVLAATATELYTFENAVYDTLWDRGGGDIVFMLAGDVENRLAVTQ